MMEVTWRGTTAVDSENNNLKTSRVARSKPYNSFNHITNAG